MILKKLSLAGLLTLSACTALPNKSPVSTLAPSQGASSSQPVTIRFQAAVKGQPFACDQKYTGVGSSNATISPLDFRFYVSQIRLINQQGQDVPLQLEQDGKWQYKNVALLDFENKTGSCDGTPDTHFEVKGTVPEGSYKGLKFDLGVPFELNHQDVNTAAAPLNLTSLFWVWRSGYKFARLDVSSTGQPNGWSLHLGSTGCTGTASSADMHVHHETTTETHGDTSNMMTQPPASCAQPNRPAVYLPEFDINKHTVVADLGQLLSKSNLDQNQANSASGCMSAADDGDCAGVFQNLGLPFGAQPVGTQQFFGLK